MLKDFILTRIILWWTFLGAVLLAFSPIMPARAADWKTRYDFGIPIDPKSAEAKNGRRIDVVIANGSMFYSIKEIKIKKGEVINFVIHNNDKLLHEFVLGSDESVAYEREEQAEGEEHTGPEPIYEVEIKPHQVGTLTWKFTEAGKFNYVCLQPLHYEQGMKGRIIVK